MKTRIISGAVGVMILIPVLWFSGTVVFPIAVAVFACAAAYEMCSCVGASKKWYYLAPSMLFALTMPLLTEWLFPQTGAYITFLAVVAFCFLLLCLAVTVFAGGKEPFSLAAKVAIGVIYVTVGFTSVVLLRRMDGGEYLFGLVFIGAWVTDTMAYFTGMLFGKHKLCPTISPKKTIEGSIGGVVFCALAFLLYGFILKMAFALTPNYPMLAISGALLSAISQIGDLAASLVKREHGVKDYGRIMPGHGGVMDRFDSIVAVAPVLLLLCCAADAFSFFL